MFKGFFLGRGINKLEELAGKALRHGLTVYGGALLADDQVNTLVAAGTILVGLALSAARTFVGGKVK